MDRYLAERAAHFVRFLARHDKQFEGNARHEQCGARIQRAITDLVTSDAIEDECESVLSSQTSGDELAVCLAILYELRGSGQF